VEVEVVEPVRLTSIAEIDHLFDPRQTMPVLILKHSLACPLSAMAWSTYRSFLAGREPGDGVLYALVEIQNARDVSAEIARRSKVKHESPQALLLVNGEAVWSASHWRISEDSLKDALAKTGR
jgi:bacillithiol system protein YtxJ